MRVCPRLPHRLHTARGRTKLGRTWLVVRGVLAAFLALVLPILISNVAAHIAARPAGEPIAMTVDTLVVEGARVRLEDRVVEPSWSWVLADLALEAHDIAMVG